MGSSDKPKYSMRYADAAHDYKEWNTPKPTKWSSEEPHYQPRYGDNHWEKTPKPSKYGQWEKENDYKEEMKRAAQASYYVPPPGCERGYERGCENYISPWN